MKLDRLIINSFKGIMRMQIDANCRNVGIWGDNATGKTSIADAIFWLLFGKDSRGQADFSIKPINPATGEELHNLNHSVDGSFSLEGGTKISLKRELVESWTKKRGSATAEFSGHNTNYLVDGVPSKKKEYDAAIAAICPEHLFSLLCSPTAFSSLHWAKQRAILLEVCGDVSDQDVIATDSNLAGVPEILAGKTVENWKKIVTGRRQEINKRMVEIPARIDELKKSDTDLKNTNSLIMVEQLTKLREKLEAKQTEIANVQAGGGAASLRDRLGVEDKKLQDIKDSHERSTRALKQRIGNDTSAAIITRNNAQSLLESDDRRIAHLNEDIKNVTEAIAALGQQWKDTQAMAFTPGPCPTCGQNIPTGQVEAARAAFNLSRSKQIEDISTKGFANREKLAALKADLEREQKEATSHQEQITAANTKIVDLQKELVSADNAPAAEELPEYIDAKRERDAIQVELDNIAAGQSEPLEKLNAELAATQILIETAEADLAKIEQHHKTTDRVNELGAEEKNLAAEFAKLEGQLNVIDNFTRAKVRMLDERINGRFEIVRFRMSEEQINGGLADTCVMTIDGVPYPDLNSAARIQGGLDIIRTLSAHHNFRPPVIVDNRESVVSLPEMDCQVISLIVSGKDQQLRVELS